MEKNLNKVRKSHPVGKVVYFHDIEEAKRFIDLYEDLFFVPKNGSRKEEGYVLFERNWYDGFYADLWFTILPKDWKEIETSLKLKKVNQCRSKEWFYEN